MNNLSTLQLLQTKISDLKYAYNKAMMSQDIGRATRLLESIAKYEDLNEIEQRFVGDIVLKLTFA